MLQVELESEAVCGPELLIQLHRTASPNLNAPNFNKTYPPFRVALHQGPAGRVDEARADARSAGHGVDGGGAHVAGHRLGRGRGGGGGQDAPALQVGRCRLTLSNPL